MQQFQHPQNVIQNPQFFKATMINFRFGEGNHLLYTQDAIFNIILIE